MSPASSTDSHQALPLPPWNGTGADAQGSACALHTRMRAHTYKHSLLSYFYPLDSSMLSFAPGSFRLGCPLPGILPALLLHLTPLHTQSSPHHSRLCWEILPHSLFVLKTLGTSANTCPKILRNHFHAYLYVVGYYGVRKGKKHVYIFCYCFSSTKPIASSRTASINKNLLNE